MRMNPVVIALVALGGCKKTAERVPAPPVAPGSGGSAGSGRVPAPPVAAGSGGSAGSGSGITAQPRFGGDPDAQPDELRFAIDRVYEHQQPAVAPPYHVPGGSWTYVDAHLVADPAARFAVGIPSFEGRGDQPSFGDMMLVPTTADAGAHFVRAFAAAFHVDVPPAVSGTLGPVRINVALLGHALADHGNDGFSGTGTWDATKWFLDDGEAEMFFDVSVAERAGMWSEKDSDYDRDVAAALALALRDGKPPPRTPDNDPTLAAIGPKLVIGPRLGSRHADVIAHGAARVLVLDDDGTHATLASVDPATGAASELYRTAKRLEVGACTRDAAHCVLRVVEPEADRSTSSSDDPATLIALDGTAIAPLAAAAFGKRPLIEAISPDGRFVIGFAKDGLVAFDRDHHRTRSYAKHGSGIEVAGWRGRGGHAIAVVDDRGDWHAPHRYIGWDLDAGTTAPSPPPDDDLAAPSSPDGSRRAEVTADGTLIVTPKGGVPRTLVFDPRDRKYAQPGCCAWMDDRYLALPGKRFAVIDTDAMKLSFLVDDADDAPSVELFGRKAIVRDRDGVRLGSVVGP